MVKNRVAKYIIIDGKNNTMKKINEEGQKAEMNDD